MNSGYGYIPVWGGYKEINPETGNKYDAASFEMRDLLVPNHKVGNSSQSMKPTNCQNWAKNLHKNTISVGYLQTERREEAYWIDRNGNVDMEFTDVSVNDLAQEFFTKLKHVRNQQKADRRFTFVNGNLLK